MSKLFGMKKMETKTTLSDVNNYYSQKEILAKMQQYLTHRETIFKNRFGKIIRCIKSNNASYLDKNMKHYSLIKNNYNVYHSIAKFSYFPLFSWNIEKRKEQYNDWTQNKKYKTFLKEYDFYMDFDNKGDYNITYQEMKTVSNILTKKNIKHMIIFSGSGFHIHSKMPKNKQTPEHAKQIAQKFVDEFGLETVDFSIYRWQGIIKTPYSIDFKTMRICTPIKPSEIDTFNIETTELLK